MDLLIPIGGQVQPQSCIGAPMRRKRSIKDGPLELGGEEGEYRRLRIALSERPSEAAIRAKLWPDSRVLAHVWARARFFGSVASRHGRADPRLAWFRRSAA